MQESVESIARRHEELAEHGEELDNLVPVKAKVKANADVVYSARYTRDEIAIIREAARKRGATPTAFIREAALAAAAGELDLGAAEKAQTVKMVRIKARELAEAVSRL
jgi:uncharacterized protein (DUF1778 family)